MLTVTIRALRNQSACDLDERVAALEEHLGRKVELDEPIALRTWADIPWKGRTRDGFKQYPRTSTRDLVWALRACAQQAVVAKEFGYYWSFYCRCHETEGLRAYILSL